MNEDYDLINSLQISSDCYFIDILPQKINSKDFFELEIYLISTYLTNFAKKISDIIIKLIYYYPAKIYLTECFNKNISEDIKQLVNQDIRMKSLLELDYIIKYIILNDVSSIQILFVNCNFLISINGQFSVDIYNANEQQIDLINSLINQENLYLKKRG